MQRPPSSGRDVALAIGLAVMLCAGPRASSAQSRVASGAIEGFVTTQGGTIRLPGALVVLTGASNQELVRQSTEPDGSFRIISLPAGSYRLAASLDGFATSLTVVTIVAVETARVNLDLALAGFSATVDVVAPPAIVSSGETLSTTTAIASAETDQFAPGTGVSGALRLLAGVIVVPGGVSIKGGRPTQAGTQIGASTIADPALGLLRMNLPDDAIDSVSVLPNPYAVEYGRFSSGLVVIQTRRAGDTWKFRVNSLDPTFRTKRRRELFHITGISGWGPRVETGGPIVKNRLFLQQSAQYRYSNDDIPSRPEDERRTTHWLSSFSRIDANLTARHSLSSTVGLFPKRALYASLGTFTPPEAAVDIREHVEHGAVTERGIWSDTVVSESTFKLDRYHTELTGQGAAPMELLPETTLGNFFNTQRRTPSVFQWVGTVSGTRQGRGGLHLFKIGSDLLWNAYRGSSFSRPVLVRRADGTLARRLEFSGSTSQQVRTADIALFVQDRLQPASRWFVEFGARLDRDGVLKHWNVTPRLGAAVLLNAAGTSVLRGGLGLFYERTPSVAGAFEQFETRTDTRFEADGVTALGPPVRFAPVRAPDLRTARSTTWDIVFDHRLNAQWSVHASVLDRRGGRELMLEPRQTGGAGELRLSSEGRSAYRDGEVGIQYSRGSRGELNLSYSRSVARSDLNAFAGYFDMMMTPVIGLNAYGPASTDVPHRLFGRGRVMPTDRWLLLGVIDWRTGFPYSVVNEALDYVGPRNDRRFPSRLRVDLGVERRFRIGRFQPWIGVRAYNALNRALPSDVQANLGSPSFGGFYNNDYRQLRLQFRFAR